MVEGMKDEQDVAEEIAHVVIKASRSPAQAFGILEIAKLAMFDIWKELKNEKEEGNEPKTNL